MQEVLQTKIAENRCITRYKEYARKYLPMTKTLRGLWVPDFEILENTTSGDQISLLSEYLVQLDKYTEKLTKAANLRNEHYKCFIKGKREEELNHKYWRTGMNRISEDAREKLKYWTGVHDSMFNSYCDKMQYRRIPPPKVLDAVNVDFEIRKEKKSIVQKPRLSDKEKKRRKKEQRKRKNAEKKLLQKLNRVRKEQQALSHNVISKGKNDKIDFKKIVDHILKSKADSTDVHPIFGEYDYTDDLMWCKVFDNTQVDSILICCNYFLDVFIESKCEMISDFLGVDESKPYRMEYSARNLSPRKQIFNDFLNFQLSFQFCISFIDACYLRCYTKDRFDTRLMSCLVDQCIMNLVKVMTTEHFLKNLRATFHAKKFSEEYCLELCASWLTCSYTQRTANLRYILNTIRKKGRKGLDAVNALLYHFNPFLIDEKRLLHIIFETTRIKLLDSSIIVEYKNVRKEAITLLREWESKLLENKH